MKLSELMTGLTPNPDFEGIATADDFVLAVDFSGTAAGPKDYIVAQEGITEHSAGLTAQSGESNYMRAGQQTTKTGTQRVLTLNGDVYIGDEFQDAILAHKLKYGTGNAVIKPYVYFNLLTGKGEKGKISIIVNNDASNGAGSNAGISATLTGRGVPEEYTYSGA
ncbi:MAG: phage tail tube protein [Oscillospiraceae bacterium]